MNRAMRIGAFGVIARALAAALFLAFSNNSSAQASPASGRVESEIVMMRCKVGGSGLDIAAFKGSAGTPGRKTGNCPENLSFLMKDGFKIRDIGHYDDVDDPFVLYTLVR